MDSLYKPLMLRLFSFILDELQDPEKSGIEIYYKLKDGLKGRIGDPGVFLKPIPKGVLYILGLYAYESYVLAYHTDDNDYGEEVGYQPRTPEHFSWYMDDFLEFVDFHGIQVDEKIRESIGDILIKTDELFEVDEKAYYQYLEASHEEMKALMDKLKESCKDALEKICDEYSMATAKRIFHDRELCEWIAELIVTIGLPGEYKQWVERVAWPVWVKPDLLTREGGRCAVCGSDFMRDPSIEVHIDHIIPITRGGSNDLVNLQLLCRGCNLKKKNNLTPVKSSIPNYLSKRDIKKKKVRGL